MQERKGRILSLDDVKHYCKVATAIKHTINIQKSIDEIYNEAEKEINRFLNLTCGRSIPSED